MTRFFTPSDYGVFAVINNLATLIATFSLFSLPNAIPIEQSWKKRKRLIQALLQITFFTFLICMIGTLSVVLMNKMHFVYLLLPVLILTIMLHRIAQGWATADASFNSMALARIVHPLTAKSFAILASKFSSSSPIYMIFFEAFAFFLQVIILIRKKMVNVFVWSNIYKINRLKICIGIIKHYSDYSLFLNLVNLTILTSASLQLIILSTNFSINETGVFSLALSMANLPVQLISLATASVIYHKFIAIGKTNPELLYKKVLEFLFGYALLGLVPFTILYFFGEIIFGVVFGPQWSMSGKIASILSLPMFFQFVLYPLLSLFRITTKIKLQFKIDLFFNTMIIISLYSFSTYYDFIKTITMLSILLSLYRIVVLVNILYISKRFSLNPKSIKLG